MTVTNSDPQASVGRPAGSPMRQLLVVQATDTEIASLRQRHKNLPERAAHAATAAKLQQASELQTKISDHLAGLDAEQRRAEQEIEDANKRLDESNTRLYSGEIKGLRAIEALQEQIAALKRHKQVSEEIILDVISRRDSVVEKRDFVNAKHVEITAQFEQQTEKLQLEEGNLEAELDKLQQTRQSQVAAIPAGLLADYEERRDKYGGVGVASLVENHCIGCDLNIQHPVAEVERMRQAPSDIPVDCSECGRIIVIAG